MQILLTLMCLTALMAAPALSNMEDPASSPPPVHDDRMKDELGLTAEQKEKWKSAMEGQRAAMKPLGEAHEALVKKLEDQLKNKAADADIQTTLAELKSNRMAFRGLMDQFENQKEGLLTPTQRARMLLRHRGPGMREKMHQMRKTPTSDKPEATKP